MKTFLTLFFLCLIVGCSSNDEGLVNDPEYEENQNEVITEYVKNEEEKTEEKTEEVQDDEIQDGMQNAESDESREKGYINIEELKLNDLYLKMTYSDLSKVMGTELEKTVENDLGDDGIMYKLTYVDGTIVYLINDEIYSIEVTSTDYLTPRGLRVGDSIEKVVELYKNPAYLDDNNWGYSTTNDYILFTLEFIENKVSKIEINLVM
ncbi:hypothetical protein J2T13_005338 [Paenibacillus sp. DS2015]|uniref:hypothetical protein n=1 Tax=Paenibacillus sp. DS2015 TaxID=3373917 RepID=UPI003D24F7FB